jgi:hypothetical protein
MQSELCTILQSQNRTTDGNGHSKGNLMDHPVQEAETRQRAAQPTIGGSVYVKP